MTSAPKDLPCGLLRLGGRRRSAVALCSVTALLPGVAPAQDLWNAGAASWFVATHWSSGIPTSASTAEVNNGGDAQIFGNSAQATTVSMGVTSGNSGTVDVISNGFLGSLAVSGVLVVGQEGSGALNISAGASVTDNSAFIGGLIVPFPPTILVGLGNARVTGQNASWATATSLAELSGSLAVTAGGNVSDGNGLAAAFTGMATTTTVNGAGSTWSNSGTFLLGGSGGTDVLTIADGGLVKAAGQATVSSGAVVNLGSVNGGAGTLQAASVANGGTINIGAGGLAGALVAGSIANRGTLHFNHTDAVTVAAALSGSGLVLKDGSGATTLNSAAAFTGSFAANSGALVLQNALAASAYVANDTATLRFDGATVTLGSAAIRANGTGAIEYNNTTVSGGYLRGSGTHTLLGGGTNTFNGVTTFNSTNIVQNGTGNFNNFTNGGALTNTANSTLSFDGVTNTSSGTITVNSELMAQDFTTNGVFVVNNGGQVDGGANNLVAGGGSRTTINSGGVVFLSDGTSMELNGALLVNNGEIDGTVNVNYGSVAKGSGAYAGTVNVGYGGKLSPGNSPGAVHLGAATFSSGGAYVFEISDAHGNPGNGLDFIDITGALNIAAGGATADSKFLIDVASLTAADQPGAAANFDPTKPYSFKLLTATGGITGFAAGDFVVDDSAFANSTAGGVFDVTQSGNDLFLNFNPVPEPGVLTALVTGLLPLLCQHRKREGFAETIKRSSAQKMVKVAAGLPHPQYRTLTSS